MPIKLKEIRRQPWILIYDDENGTHQFECLNEEIRREEAAVLVGNTIIGLADKYGEAKRESVETRRDKFLKEVNIRLNALLFHDLQGGQS